MQANKRSQSLAVICREFSIQILYAFGSRAKETRQWLDETLDKLSPSLSDLDVGVKPATPAGLTAREKVLLALALEELFGISRVDLVSIPEADPFLAANIIRGERLYADDSYLADEYDLYILRRAGDLAPLERERQALILGEEYDIRQDF